MPARIFRGCHFRCSITCEKKDLWAIAKGQEKLENEISKKANRVLFCDTNLLQTKLYSEIYYEGYCDPRIEKSATENYYDLYFLCDVDIPWVPDDLRDKPNERVIMFKAFKKELEKQRNKKYEERSSEEEDNMFHGIVAPRGGTVTMMTTTVTNMADNKRIILVMAMEIERLLEETNTEPSAVWRAQRQQILPQEVE